MKTQKQQYVVGFAFSFDYRDVCLIEKQKPAWQKGLLNGVGGKVEPEEHRFDAMVREFEEETGLKTTVQDWHYFCVLEGEDFQVFCFHARLSTLELVITSTEEKIFVLPVHQVGQGIQTLKNVPWLIAMALSCDDILPPLIEYRSGGEAEDSLKPGYRSDVEGSAV